MAGLADKVPSSMHRRRNPFLHEDDVHEIIFTRGGRAHISTDGEVIVWDDIGRAHQYAVHPSDVPTLAAAMESAPYSWSRWSVDVMDEVPIIKQRTPRGKTTMPKRTHLRRRNPVGHLRDGSTVNIDGRSVTLLTSRGERYEYELPSSAAVSRVRAARTAAAVHSAVGSRAVVRSINPRRNPFDAYGMWSGPSKMDLLMEEAYKSHAKWKAKRRAKRPAKRHAKWKAKRGRKAKRSVRGRLAARRGTLRRDSRGRFVRR